MDGCSIDGAMQNNKMMLQKENRTCNATCPIILDRLNK